MRVFVVIAYADGEDFDGSDITVEGVFTDLVKAQEKMNDVFDKDFAPATQEAAEVDRGEMSCDIVNFDADYHACVWIKEKEVE